LKLEGIAMAGTHKPTDKGYQVLTKKTAQEARFEPVVTMSWQKKGNLNPPVFQMLQSTTAGVFNKVELGALDREGNQAALAAADADSEGPITLHISPSGTTARFSMTRLVTKFPALKVQKGRIRKFPVSVSANGAFLVLDLKNSVVEVVGGGPAPEKPASGARAADTEVAAAETDDGGAAHE
jgi:hypothetical protein